jgi:hypothetical protein
MASGFAAASLMPMPTACVHVTVSADSSFVTTSQNAGCGTRCGTHSLEVIKEKANQGRPAANVVNKALSYSPVCTVAISHLLA